MFSKEMIEKYKSYVKNMGSGSVASIAGGLAGSYIAELFSASPEKIAGISTVSQYLASIPTFSVLHARYNRHLYTDTEDNFLWNPFVKDVTKLTTALLPLDWIYVPVRGYVNYYFQSKGFDPYISSILSDAICIPVYVAASIPLARYLNIIRPDEVSDCSMESISKDDEMIA